MNNRNEHREYPMYQLVNKTNDDGHMWVTDDDDDFEKVSISVFTSPKQDRYFSLSD